MKKPYLTLLGVVVAVAIAAGAVVALLPRHHSSTKAAATKTPGIPSNLIACQAGQTGVECLAVYKGQCVVFAFDQAGRVAGAQPVESKYCGL